ncbi:MAG: hypothetical protein DRJ98_00970 [Thermoprotei archaeon]|nr:MAG: hypothetical protein DRJ98_00970 [Thermoprotei archaeon]RLF18222.1 MAG: hypothetical protein DRN06_02035 [Thermoprotei archaeon]
MIDLKVIAADSASALLDYSYRPTEILAIAAIVAEPPYLEPVYCEAYPLFRPVGDRSVLLEEFKLCLKLLDTHRPDELHLDITAGSIDLSTTNVEEALTFLSSKARKALGEVLPSLVEELRRSGVKVSCLLIGKESLPVRLAELTAGVYGVYYASLKALQENAEVRVGLPKASTLKVEGASMWLESLLPGEERVKGCAVSNIDLQGLSLIEHPNPVAAGFRVVAIRPRR